jgi:hypothetical protein
MEPTNSRRQRLVTRLAATATAALLALGLAAPQTASAATYPVHAASDALCVPFEIAPNVVTAWGTNIYREETVYWTGALQFWSTKGWVNVKNGQTTWLPFTSSYIRSADWTPDPGGLVGVNKPHFQPAYGAGWYRIASLFFWSSTGLLSPWEYGHSCYLTPFST